MLLAKQSARAGDVVVLDVRPAEEYASGHLPHARSLPLDELGTKLKSCPSKRRWWRIAAAGSA